MFKPMLAKEPRYDDLGNPIVGSFPVGVQIKLDGIRASVVNGKLVSRTLKPIPNAEIRAALERPEFEGFDGELIVGSATAEGCMQTTSSFVMSESKVGAPWVFFVFDKWDHPGNYWQRWQAAEDATFSVPSEARGRVMLLAAQDVRRMSELIEFEQNAVAQGHEGIIVRDPSAPYKFGRSGLKGPLLKVKRFIDFEAEIVGVYEEMHNANEAKKDALGRTERSTAKAGMVGKGRLGGFELRALNGPCAGVEFRCGTGFNAQQRQAWWVGQTNGDPEVTLVGETAKIKSFPVGVKEAPRFPVFLGFRNMEVDG